MFNAKRTICPAGLAAMLSALLFICPASARAQGLFEEAMAESEDQSEEGEKPAAAEEQGAAGAGTGGLSLGGIGFELNGHVRGVLYLGKYPDKDAVEVKSGYGEAMLKVVARKGEYGDAFAELRLRGGYEDGEAVFTVDPREAYINLYLGPVDLRFGHQVIIWGRADAVNPTNNLTPMDMRVRSPLEDDMRLANLALRAHLNLDPFRWEVVWVPFFRASHFPNFQIPSTTPLAIKMDDPEYPDANLKNSTIATRLHFTWPAFEFSVSYLIGTSTFPGIYLKEIDFAKLQVTVAMASYQHQVVGADFATTIGSVGLRGEFAYRQPQGYETYEHAPLPDLQYVLGVDREFFAQVNVILQYSGRAVLDWDAVQGSGSTIPALFRDMFKEKRRMIASQQEQFQHSATLRVQWMLLHDTLSLEMLGMYNFSTEELLLRPRLTYDITDALRFSAGGMVYLGADNTLFDMIEESQSSGFVELLASF